jgi:hypothetical protein
MRGLLPALRGAAASLPGKERAIPPPSPVCLGRSSDVLAQWSA